MDDRPMLLLIIGIIILLALLLAAWLPENPCDNPAEAAGPVAEQYYKDYCNYEE